MQLMKRSSSSVSAATKKKQKKGGGDENGTAKGFIGRTGKLRVSTSAASPDIRSFFISKSLPSVAAALQSPQEDSKYLPRASTAPRTGDRPSPPGGTNTKRKGPKLAVEVEEDENGSEEEEEADLVPLSRARARVEADLDGDAEEATEVDPANMDPDEIEAAMTEGRIPLLSYIQQNGKEFFIKLMLRKHKTERLSKLCFPRLEDMEAALAELTTLGFITNGIPDPPDDPASYLPLLSRDELTLLAKDRRLTTAGVASAQLRDSLAHAVTHQRTLFPTSTTSSSSSSAALLARAARNILGRTLRLLDGPVETFIRLFVAHNRATEWPSNPFLDHIRANLRVNRQHHHPYAVARLHITWPTRAEFDGYFRALRRENAISTMVDEGIGKVVAMALGTEAARIKALAVEFEEPLRMALAEKAVWDEEVKRGDSHVSGIPWMMTFTQAWVRTRIVSHLAFIQARLHRTQDRIVTLTSLLAQHLYLRRSRGAWHDDLALCLTTSKQLKLAVEACERALEDPMVQAGHRRSIEARLQRLTKKDGRKYLFHLLRANPPETCVVARRTYSVANRKALWWDDVAEQEVTVEMLALARWERDGWKGFHSENSVITTLFGMLFWDVIFCDDTAVVGGVAGVFCSPFQDAPLDLGTEFFWESRRGLIEGRLREIESGGFASILEEVDDKQREMKTRCRGVNWKWFAKQDVLEIAECFGGPALSRICEEFARCYWAHCGGVPDLCVWHYETRRVRMIEVKGQGDRLSSKQMVWLDFLLEVGIEVEVFKVVTPEKDEAGTRKKGGMKKVKKVLREGE
ncbi:Fanconi-associated nuclease 1 [Irineochytrium annulatum]|nr:Fanconi-associated nuclease 1 [Irineochytrium annulatum]